MNKNLQIVLILGVLLIGAAGAFIYTQKQTKLQTQTQIVQVTPTPVPTATPVPTVEDKENITYTIKTGTVSYDAKKQFIGKDLLNVIGTTSDVTGTGQWNKTSKEISAEVMANLNSLETDSDSRDAWVNEAVKPEAKFSIDKGQVIEMGNFNKNIVGDLTINNITKKVTFKASGSLTDMELKAKGESIIKLSDFEVKAPSMINVYTVAEDLKIIFDITATIK